MFTIEAIKASHAKVKSGADFPRYVQDLITLGVKTYDTYVTDGHTDYYGDNDFKISTMPVYAKLTIALTSDPAAFKADLKAHQQGNTDYPTFCSDCARSGIEKWVMDMTKMTCSYYDTAGNEILVETVPH